MEQGRQNEIAGRGLMSGSLFGRRVLILVPHPDDEVVACCAALLQAQATGTKIYALYLTHGCIARDALWPWQRLHYEKYIQIRRKEAEAVARFLNISALNWSVRPARHLWQEMPAVYREIVSAIEQHAIDQIWVPAFEGGNPDHDALNAIGSVLKVKHSVLEFAEYNFFNGRAQSQTFPSPNSREQVLLLTPQEQLKKRKALAFYKSEQCNLSYVKIERECYRPLADYDYQAMPHEGQLWYTRFQWVPFKHPRIDFSKPEQIAGKIGSFLRAFSAPI